MALFEGYDRAFDFRLLADRPFEGLDLALADVGVDALDLDVEQLLDRLLDLRLGRTSGDLEHHLVAFRGERRFLGDDRRDDHIVIARIGRAHLKRASNASSADLVSTNVGRRSMSSTLMPCHGRTPRFGKLRAAKRKLV